MTTDLAPLAEAAEAAALAGRITPAEAAEFRRALDNLESIKAEAVPRLHSILSRIERPAFEIKIPTPPDGWPEIKSAEADRWIAEQIALSNKYREQPAYIEARRRAEELEDRRYAGRPVAEWPPAVRRRHVAKLSRRAAAQKLELEADELMRKVARMERVGLL